MSLETKREFDSIQLTADGVIWVKEDVVVMDGPTELARSVLRTSYAPGSDIPADAPDQVNSIAAMAWTPAVIEAYRASQQKDEIPSPAYPDPVVPVVDEV